MRFDILTLFPQGIFPYFQEGIIKRAQEEDLIKINLWNLRQWTEDKHQTVDDRPFGGGGGMILKVGPIYEAVKELEQRRKKTKIVLFSPRGEKFSQPKAKEYSQLDQLILISGRYEGVDERVAQYIADEVISIGDYVLMGGDLPAMVVVEAVARLKSGVAGEEEWLEERITVEGGFQEYPQYTRPASFSPRIGKKWKVPDILLSGDHKEIQKWREKHGQNID
jgi:tRNA (guanine37-N1)-methyltransferase